MEEAKNKVLKLVLSFLDKNWENIEEYFAISDFTLDDNLFFLITNKNFTEVKEKIKWELFYLQNEILKILFPYIKEILITQFEFLSFEYDPEDSIITGYFMNNAYESFIFKLDLTKNEKINNLFLRLTKDESLKQNFINKNYL